MNIIPFIHLFKELDTDEVIRIELINGNKIYYLPSDAISVEPNIIIIKKLIKNKRQQIIINANTISVICTMSRITYEAKLQRGELYV